MRVELAGREMVAASPEDWRDIRVEVAREPLVADHVDLPPMPCVNVVAVLAGRSRYQERDPHGPWDAALDLRPGSVFVTGPLRPAVLRWQSLTPRPVEAVSVDLDLGYLHRRAQEADLDPARIEIVDRSGIQDDLLAQLGATLRMAAATARPVDRLLAEGLAATLAAHLLRDYSSTRLRDRRGEDRLPLHAVRRVRAYVEEHLADPLGLEVLAQVAGVSLFHFVRGFHASTGDTPAQFVAQRRMARAARLLVRSDLSVLEVALAVGYGSPSRFGARFRRQYGLTPSAFRRLEATRPQEPESSRKS